MRTCRSSAACSRATRLARSRRGCATSRNSCTTRGSPTSLRAVQGSIAIAYHDACHALRVQHLRDQPRALLRTIKGVEVLDVPDGDVCCGAAGLYNVLEPETSSELRRRKGEALASTGADVVASANPGCTTQTAAGLRHIGSPIRVLHPVQILDRAYAAESPETAPAAFGDPPQIPSA